MNMQTLLSFLKNSLFAGFRKFYLSFVQNFKLIADSFFFFIAIEVFFEYTMHG